MKLGLFLIIFSSFLQAQSVTVEIEELPEDHATENVSIEKRPTTLMIDNFEDGDATKFREWWTFDKVLLKTSPNEPSKTHYIEKVSLEISGSSNNWYAGGLGTYLNEDASYYDTLKLVIYSPKINSGAIRIELYDDDNNNKVIDINDETGLPSKDDLFIYDLNLIWQGWKVVSIPISEFIDFNNDVGDNIWNPNQSYGSSGLTQIQIVVLSSKMKSETISFYIDTIKFN